MAFFFLLRVGEYTKPKYCKKNGETKRATRTVQFAVNNIGFFKKGKILPRASPLPKLLSADSCTMKITNQKNGRMGETIHQHATNRVHHILINKGQDSALICDYYDNNTKTWGQVTQTDMIKHLRTAIKTLNLKKLESHQT